MLMTAVELVEGNPNPSHATVAFAVASNFAH
jgi:hypothetical protein